MLRPLALALTLATPTLAEDVDLELVLLADASGSIDMAEIKFQRPAPVGWVPTHHSPLPTPPTGPGIPGPAAFPGRGSFPVEEAFARLGQQVLAQPPQGGGQPADPGPLRTPR